MCGIAGEMRKGVWWEVRVIGMGRGARSEWLTIENVQTARINGRGGRWARGMRMGSVWG